MLKKVLQHSAIYGLAPQLPKIISFFTLPIITSHLTAFDYGVSGLVTAYTGAISVFSTLGLRVKLVNSFYKHPNWYPYVWRQISGFLYFWNIPFAILSALIIYIAVPAGAMKDVWMIMALNVAGILAFGRASLLGFNYLQLTKQPKKVATRTVISALIAIVFNLYFIAYLNMGYMGWFWSSFLSTMFTNIFYWYLVNIKLGMKPIYNFKWRFIKESLRISLPTVPHYYSTYLLDVSDRMVMSFLKIPAEQIGKYNSSYAFGNYVNSMGMATGLALGPFYQENYKAKKYQLCRNLIFNLQTLFIAGTFLFSLWLKEIFHLLIKNAELAAMYPMAIIIIMSYNYRPMYLGISMAVYYNEKNNKLWRFTLGAGVVSVLLNVSMIPFFGFQFAAITTFITYMLMGFSMFLYKPYRNLLGANYKPLFWLMLIVVVCVAAYIVKDIPIIWKTGCSMLPLILLGVALKKFKTAA